MKMALQSPPLIKNYSKAILQLVLVFLLVAFNSCTNDRFVNTIEVAIDTDGDGVLDSDEIIAGTDKNNPCDPRQNPGYVSFDPLNVVWSSSDCDYDGIKNGDEIALATDPYLNNDVYVIPEFLSKLSELKIFQGSLSDLKFSDTVHEFALSTPLFTDYARNVRSVAIPPGKQMEYKGEGLPLFPDNTILSKTFYYLNDERDPAMGKKILETRILIKKNGVWQAGNYVWNEEQTEAFLDDDAHTVPVNWIDQQGNNRSVNYKVPPKILCFQCHDNNGNTGPIGVKSRALNFVHNQVNQIQYFVDKGLFKNVPDISQIKTLPDWADTSLPLEERARAYLDVNCAHCHQPGGSYNRNYGDSFEFRLETSFEDSNIYQERVAIKNRMNTQIPSYFMPLIGTTVVHEEGVALINAYIDSLE